MSKIKLAYVTHGLSSNGIESLLVSVMKHTDTRKYDVSFVIAIDEGVACLHESTVKALGAKVIRVCDMDSLKKKFVYMKSLEKIFRENQFDIVHANMDLLNGIVLRSAKKAGIKKCICHAHNSSSQYSITGNKSAVLKTAQKIYQSVMKKMILMNSDILLGCSDKANEYLYGKNAKDASVINNGIVLDAFVNGKENRAKDIRNADINFVAVGRLSAQKNPLFIIDIIKELSLIRQDFVLNWVGSGEMQEQVEDKIKNDNLSEFIYLTGVRTDVPDILHSSDYFILPSLFEGLPLVLVEAQASGLECFVSDEITVCADLGACHYLPLDIGAKKWAEYINDTINSGARITADEEKVKQFDINKTVSDLDKIYCEE